MLIEHIARTDELVYTDGALLRKIELLMAISYDSAHSPVKDMRALANQAKAAGATEDDMA
jgi:hypothetical protein